MARSDLLSEEYLKRLNSLPRGTIKKFKEKLNKEHGLEVGADAQLNGSKRGQQKRLYGDYLYASDYEAFIWSMFQEIDDGRFKP